MKVIVTVKDSKADCYGPLITLGTLPEAIRSFQQLVRDTKSQINMYPDDYDMYQVATWDDQTGKLEAFDTPHHIVKAIQMTEQSLNGAEHAPKHPQQTSEGAKRDANLSK